MGWGRHLASMEKEEECLQDFDRKVKRKEITRKT
jgi:hypothetical protein